MEAGEGSGERAGGSRGKRRGWFPADRMPDGRDWMLLGLIVAVLQGLGLANHGLLEPDEGRYANMAVEWTEFGEHSWLEPVLSDVGHFDKPPLIYWAAGTGYLWFGREEWAVRLPSVLGGLMTLLGVALLAHRRGGAKGAWWAVLVCATTFHFWALSHLLSPDMLMCGFATLGAALCLEATPDRGKRGWCFWVAGALLWTLGWWTKATAALVPLGALAAALWLTDRRDLLAALRPVRLLLVILMLGSPWYLMMMARHEELRDFFLHRELAGRVAGHVDGRRGFPGFHVAVAAVFWLPWWPVLAAGAWKARAQWLALSGWRQRLRAIPWEAIAALSVVAIFSAVSSKLITYVITGLPYLTAVTGCRLSAAVSGYGAQHRRKAVTGLTLAAGAGMVVVALALPALESRLGRNSSLRLPIETVREQGADWVVCDEFWPGAEFYFGENVWFVDVKDILQVHDLEGQFPQKHFLTKSEAAERVAGVSGSVWLIQIRDHAAKPQKWERQLLAGRQDPDGAPLEVGDFVLSKLK